MSKLVTLYSATDGFDPAWIGPFKALCAEITTGGDRHAPNYAFDAIDLDGHMALHALVDEGDPTPERIRAFAGVYRRAFWPEGVWRFQNRTWIRQAARHDMGGASAKAQGGDGWFDVADHIGAAQVALCRKMRVKAAFISIEGERAHARLRYLHRHVRPRWNADDLLWRISKAYLPVAHGHAKPSWQPILYADILCGYELASEPWFRVGKPFEIWNTACR